MIFDYLFAMRSNPRLIDFNRPSSRTCVGRACVDACLGQETYAQDFWLLFQELPIKWCYLGLLHILAHISSLNLSACALMWI